MKPGKVSRQVVADRLQWINRMLAVIRDLPVNDREAFFSDTRNSMTAESGLRRALEALFDLGRHILAKGFGFGVSEYKEIAIRLRELKVISDEDARLLIILAGYWNRLVHFYHEVDPKELYDICANRLTDIEKIALAYQKWIGQHVDNLE
ncbi:MAG: hypothetical protein A2W35_16855 [Chloroflexi bacterium RBG_16_57_11]|nr:MAG: hypothetical protein A2W35_16855 [Chloroflexi bacterium RBG_16_57_11]